MNDLQRRIAYYVRTLDVGNSEYKHRADFVSDKWCRIVKVSSYYDGSPCEAVRDFVALTNFITKTLGDVKAGNIHCAGGWKRPVKVFHGSVFDFDLPADFQPLIALEKPKRGRRKMLAATIRNEIADTLGVPKARLNIRWDGHCLTILVIDTTDEEVFRVGEYANTHRERFGDCVIGVFADGRHEDGLLDTHQALDVLNRIADEQRTH